MRYLLVPLGSSGDVHPFLGIAAALRDRGRDVTVAVNGWFEPVVRRLGLNYVEIGSAEEFRRALDDPLLWHPKHGLRYVIEQGIVPAIRPVYQLISERYIPGETVVVAAGIALGARIAADKLGVPVVTVQLQPLSIFTAHEHPVYPNMNIPRWWPSSFKRAFFRFGHRYVVDPIVGREVNALRRELDLPPARRILLDWWQSPTGILGLYPDWFGPPQPDRPDRLRLTGFPLFDEAGVCEIDPELGDFLDQGDPPIVFTFGSAMKHAHILFQESVRACEAIGRRGILLTKFPEQIPKSLPRSIRRFDYAPLSELLPRASLIVHHGGIGTSAQALAAGIPQLVAPFTHDQPDNAARLERLGVARTIPALLYRSENASREIGHILSSAKIAERAREIAKRIDKKQSLEQACKAIEEFGEANP